MNEFALMLLSLPPLLLALTIHEYCHGYVAYRMGDPTAKNAGRLTFNPLKHIDIVGFIAFLLFHIGWAKPVPINPDNFRNIRKGLLYTSLAGPLANFLIAIPIGLTLRIIRPSNLLFPVITMIEFGLILNLVLCAFNLIPIPPLDGSKILFSLLPSRYAHVEYWLQRYGFFILIGLIFLNVAGIPILWIWIGPFVNFFGKLFSGLTNLV